MAKTHLHLRAIDGAPTEKRIVRPELNLEQWPLFIPSQARGRAFEVRTIEHTETRPNGDTVTDSVTVDFCSLGTLTAKDQRVLYALFQNWTEKGCPLTYCYYSAYKLSQLLKQQEGKATQKAILESLRRLHAVTITFKRCFHNAETSEVYEDEEPIHILSELKIRVRKRLKNGKYEPIKSEGYIAFHPRILKNLIKNYTRRVLFDVVLSLTSDTAQLLYGLVDRQLATKETYTKATAALFQELGLQGKDYRYASARKRAIEKPLAELLGKPLSSGGIIGVAELEETKDKTDFKVIFKKRAAIRVVPAAKKKGKEPNDAEELVRYFHQAFFGTGEKVQPGRRELEQATKLISELGFDTAKSVIDYARREAPKTNFEIKAFGGVMQYQAQAVAAVESAREHEERRKKREEERGRELAGDIYFRFFQPAFRAHQRAELDVIRKEHTEAYAAFESWLNENHARKLRMVTGETLRQELATGRAAEFFNELRPELGLKLSDFPTWDAEHNVDCQDPLEWYKRGSKQIHDELDRRLREER